MTTPQTFEVCDSLISHYSLIRYTNDLIAHDSVTTKENGILKAQNGALKQSKQALEQDKSDLETQKLNLLTVLGERDRTIKKMQLKFAWKDWRTVIVGGLAGFAGFKIGQWVD